MAQTSGSTGATSGMSWAERAKKAVPQPLKNKSLEKRTVDENDSANPPLTPTPAETQTPTKVTASQSLTSQALNIVAAETQSVRNVWNVRTASTHLSQKQQQQQQQRQKFVVNMNNNVGKAKAKEKETTEEYPALVAAHVGSGKSHVNGNTNARANIPPLSAATSTNPSPPTRSHPPSPPPTKLPPPTNDTDIVNGIDTLTPSTSTASVKSIPVSTSASSSSSGTGKKTKWIPIPAEEMQAAADATLRVERRTSRNQSRNPSRSQSQTQSLASSVQNSPRNPFVVVLPPNGTTAHSSRPSAAPSPRPIINGGDSYYYPQPFQPNSQVNSHAPSPVPIPPFGVYQQQFQQPYVPDSNIPPRHQHHRDDSYSSQTSGSSHAYSMMPPPPMAYYPYPTHQPVPQYWYAQPQQNGFVHPPQPPRNDFEVIVVQPDMALTDPPPTATVHARPPPPRESAAVAGAGISNKNNSRAHVVFGDLDKIVDLSISTDGDEESTSTSRSQHPSSSFCIGGEPPHANKPVPTVEDVIVDGGWVFGTTTSTNNEEPSGEPEAGLPNLSTPMRLDIQRLSPAQSSTSASLSPLVGFPPNITVLGGPGTPSNPTPFQQNDAATNAPASSVLMQMAPLPQQQEQQPGPMYPNHTMYQPQPQPPLPMNVGMPPIIPGPPYGMTNMPMNIPMNYQPVPPPMTHQIPESNGNTSTSEWEVKDFGYGFGAQGPVNRERDAYAPRARRESIASNSNSSSSGRRGRGGGRGVNGRNYAPRNMGVTGNSGYQNPGPPPQFGPPFDGSGYYQPQVHNQTTYYDAFQVNPNVAPAGAATMLPGQGQPPVPMPRSTLAFPLDPTRYYLLGQIEYYLSPENMAQDFFLRTQMDSRGWVSIALLASFRRVQQLTTDPRLVRDVLCLSTMVQVAPGNEEEELGWVRMGGWEQFALEGALPTRVVEFDYTQQQPPPSAGYGEYGLGPVYDGGYPQPQIEKISSDQNNLSSEERTPHDSSGNTTEVEVESDTVAEKESVDEDVYVEDEEDDVVFIMSREASTGAFGS